MRLFQIFDKRAQQVIGNIIAYRHPAAAVRVFTDALQNKDSIISQHPEDFDLIELGEQDDETGVITAATIPQTVLSGRQWYISQQQPEAPGGPGADLFANRRENVVTG